MIRRICTLLVSLLVMAAGVVAGQPPAIEEFRPLSELPPSEQLPGGVFVVAAYSFVWVATMIYIWSIYSRLRRVEADMKALEKRTAPESRTR
jgi:hypothetical protein